MSAEVSPLLATFQKKYTEFAADLRETFPELATVLDAALAIPEAERTTAYSKEVLAKHAGILEKKDECPGTILPGVTLTADLWDSCGDRTKKAIFDYISILDLCCLYESGAADGEAAGAGAGFSKEWADRVMREWRSRLDRVDFDGLANKFMSFFGGDGALPQLPEKFLKGKLAKLAEDMVREFKPEDFGLRPEDMAAVESDPTRAFEILMQASAANPNMLQKAMGRVAKKLQEKVMRGELRPQELVAEAEELIKEFQSHPAFVEMMESFRSAFSFEDPDLARAAGRDSENRLSIARSRLRKKLDARKGGASAPGKK
jgi:hypothetical protein